MSKELTKEQRIKRSKLVANQWLAFSKTTAYKEFILFMESNQETLLYYAEEGVVPNPSGNGTDIPISGEKSNMLLQNRRGIGIVKAHVEGIVKSTTS